MRHNIADALTFVRLAAVVPLFCLIVFDQWTAAVVVFVIAILSDGKRRSGEMNKSTGS